MKAGHNIVNREYSGVQKWNMDYKDNVYAEDTYQLYMYSASLVLVLWFIYVYKLGAGGSTQKA